MRFKTVLIGDKFAFIFVMAYIRYEYYYIGTPVWSVPHVKSRFRGRSPVYNIITILR